MTPEEQAWVQAYVHGQREHIRDAGDGWPEIVGDVGYDAKGVLLSMVNLGVHIRHITRNHSSPLEMAANELAYLTDGMLAALVKPLDDREDAAIVARWRQALAEVQELLR